MILPLRSVTAQTPQIYENFTISCPSLGDSIFENGETQDLTIVFPKNYATTKNYPVIYCFSGYMCSTLWMKSRIVSPLRSYLNDTLIVIVHGIHPVLRAVFFTNSPVTGNWEDYFINDVISYVDSNYPTINKSEARGVMGFSMGGLNGLYISFRHANLFNAVYALSPPISTETESMGAYWFSNENRDAQLSFQEELVQTVENCSNQEDFIPNFLEVLKKKYYIRYTNQLVRSTLHYQVTYGLAFAPNVSKPGIYHDFLYETSESGYFYHTEQISRYNSGMGNFTSKLDYAFTQNYNLSIGLYAGEQEPPIYSGVTYLSSLITSRGFSHQCNYTDHGHSDGLDYKMRAFAAPFFQENLSEAIDKPSIPGYSYGMIFVFGVVAVLTLKKVGKRRGNIQVPKTHYDTKFTR